MNKVEMVLWGIIILNCACWVLSILSLAIPINYIRWAKAGYRFKYGILDALSVGAFFILAVRYI